MKIQWLLFSAALLSFGTANAADIGQLKGEWVGEGVSCSALQTYENEKLIKISASKFGFYESDCAIRKVARKGDRYTVSLACEGEGESFPVRWVATMQGKNKLSVQGGFTYKRCK